MSEKLSEIPPRFRGFLYEPSNVREVMGLFFRTFDELNVPICIDEIRDGFPDCLAWEETEEDYEEVKIEFELLSRSFKESGKDSSECDLIVCWEDNWPDSPLGVIELREELEDTGEDLILSDGPKYSRGSREREKFLESVKEENPEIIDMQKKIYEALESSEDVEIRVGGANYSFKIPSTDYRARMGVLSDGRIMIGFKGLQRRERRKLAAGFLYKLDIDMDHGEDWTEAFQLGKDLKEENVYEFLDIILVD